MATTVEFKSARDVLVFLPEALGIAFLAPFPWQWGFTGGATGIMRPISAIEIIMIAFMIPSLVKASWRRLSRLRPDEWVIVLFIGGIAIGLGFIMPNVGTLFRLRLSFLFPALILASTALPEFVYRSFDRLSYWLIPSRDQSSHDERASL